MQKAQIRLKLTSEDAMHPSAHSPNSTPRISPAKASSFKRKSKTSTLEQVTKKFREFHFIYLLKTKFANVSTYKRVKSTAAAHGKYAKLLLKLFFCLMPKVKIQIKSTKIII